MISFLFSIRFCIALEEMDRDDNPIALVLGCGSPLVVRKRVTFATAVPVIITRPPPLEIPDHLRLVGWLLPLSIYDTAELWTYCIAPVQSES